MAKKPRTPPPPRRNVQAPRARRDERPPGDRGRTLWIVIGAAVLGLAAVAAAAAVWLAGGSEPASAALQQADCTVETFPAQSQNHITEPDEDFEYNSDPPTSGPHHPTPAPFDVYDAEVEQYRLLHNLEHGGVVIQYGEGVPGDVVSRLVEWYRQDPNGIVIAPYSGVDEDEFTLGAWVAQGDTEGETSETGQGVLARCPAFDEAAFDAFVETYGFRGPEEFPRELLTPGS